MENGRFQAARFISTLAIFSLWGILLKNVNVFLIGGAPGAGKTTLGCTLAAKLGIASVTIDDLMTVAQTVTTPETHPGLHVMRNVPYLEYFTNSSVDQLKTDANIQHEATWPFVKSLILKHATWDPSPIVIDGWHLRPNRVAELNLHNIWSGWIVISPSVLTEREKKNLKWLQGSSSPERMYENFLARSLWYNDLIQEQAASLQMNILPQTGDDSVDDLCNMILKTIDG
jgi:2-phosphoglycerate kinase